MSRNERIILDTSTLVSAALRTGSIPHQAVMKAIHSCHLYASVESLDELEQVLDREKFDKYLPRESRQAFVAMIRQNSQLYTLQNADLLAVHPPCRDPKDNQFLALALAAEADALISSDDDLLVLHPWRGIPVLTPSDFLRGANLLP
jgi:hypothetical protein